MAATGKGGARPGAGRKPNAELYAGQLGSAADQLAAALPEVAEKLIELAPGLQPRQKWMLAGLVTRKDPLRMKPHPDRDAGFTDPEGKPCDSRGEPLPPEPPDDVWLDDKGKPLLIDM